jgi:predicted  nucleic acid-binding Zn-ribbon protein
MHPDLVHLAAADSYDRELIALKGARQKADDALAAGQAADQAARAAVTAAEAALAANKARQRELNREIETYEARRTSARRVLEGGGGDPAAAERQLASVGAILDGLETELLERMDAQEALDRELLALRAAAGAASKARAELEQSQPAEVASLKASFERIVPLRDAELDAVDRVTRQKYLDVRDRRGSAVSEIVRDCCKGCNVFIQPQHVADLKRGLLVPCRGCGRWLLPPS